MKGKDMSWFEDYKNQYNNVDKNPKLNRIEEYIYQKDYNTHNNKMIKINKEYILERIRNNELVKDKIIIIKENRLPLKIIIVGENFDINFGDFHNIEIKIEKNNNILKCGNNCKIHITSVNNTIYLGRDNELFCNNILNIIKN